ncbi:unnamed protein product, partial [Effrenium voratum]
MGRRKHPKGEAPVGRSSEEWLLAVASVPGGCPPAWLLGAVDLLPAPSCCRFSWASRLHLQSVREACGHRLALNLGEGFLRQDLVPPVPNPILALSHLESLAHSGFLFSGLRHLLRCREEVRASIAARLAALIYHYTPPRNWASAVETLLRLCQGQGPELKTLLSKGGEVAQLLQGLPELLPKTRTAQQLKAGKMNITKLICQLLERLAYPPRQASLLLQISLPMDRANQVIPNQSDLFKQTLRALEGEVWCKGDQSLDVIVVEAR